MQNRILSFALLGFLLLTSCDSFSSFNEAEVWEPVSGPQNATDTLNRYTDLINDAQDQVSALDDSVQYAEYDLVNYDPAYGVSFTCNFNLWDRDSLYTDTMNPVGLEESEAQDLIAQATVIFNTLDAIETECKEFHKYVAAQEYKTDLEKGKTQVQSLYDLMDSYYDTHEALLDKIDTLFETYSTWVVDPNDPISVAIDTMSKDLKQAKLILDLIEDATATATFTRSEELQGLYDTLLAQTAAHSGANAPIIDSYYRSNFDSFYDTMDLDYLTNTKVALSALQAQNIDDLSAAYDNVLIYYNLMIDYYNYFLDATGY